MIRANVYFVEPLTPELKTGLYDGLSIIGQHVGGVSVRRVSRLSVPLNNGRVEVSKVGLRKLEIGTHLHVIAAPLTTDRLGIAAMGSGVSWLNIAEVEQSYAQTTAHEVAHSLGFMLKDAPRRDFESPAHCVDENCIMHEAETEPNRQTPLQLGRDVITKNVGDFCLSCSADIRSFGEDHAHKILYGRTVAGGVSPVDHIGCQ